VLERRDAITNDIDLFSTKSSYSTEIIPDCIIPPFHVVTDRIKRKKNRKIFSTQRSPIFKTALHFGQFLGFATFSSGKSDMCGAWAECF